ncbi:adenylate/guanylate cyclase domain-containing protein [Streptomyces sp. V4-01]|uniref:Adenylate/guanylate cyclase domain-containing protein n=1 Tax=Actinacidiphila polyblastidii TaxID=3110430 RepID=A0ABU7PLL7_9ACTN|nr:adenylate/guanylate cyclase domain-containing protein [Streptomyces sp. V4-01]
MCATRDHPAAAQFCAVCGTRLISSVDVPDSRRVITALFADLVGSTALGERLDPEPLRQVMVRFYTLMRDCLERHGGTVEKFIGDAVMAVFGVPRVHEDDALRAVRAAWDMRQALMGLNAELGDELGIEPGTERGAGLTAPLRLRIGVNTGEVLSAGMPGVGQSLVSGDTVNIAARLEQHAPVGEILLGPDTHRALRGRAVSEPADPLVVKGKSRPLQAWRLLDLVSDPSAVPRAQTPLVGRRIELGRLELAWEQTTATAAPHLFTLLGEAGIGKSRLAAEFTRAAAERGAAVAVARCQPYGDGGTAAVLAEVVRQLLGAGPGTEDAAPPPSAGSHSPAVRALTDRLLSGERDAVSPADFGTVGLLLSAVARQRPVVLVLDDLQWAQPTLLDLVDHLIDTGRGSRLMMVCVSRLDLLDTRPQWGSGKLSATTLAVPPLAPDDCRRLVEAIGEVLLHGDSPAVERVTAVSEGNPLFAEQMAALLADGGGTEDLPPTVQALLAARLDRLSPAERDLLGRGSVVGRQFTVPDLTALGGPPPASGGAPYAAPLAALLRRRLIEPTEPPDDGTYRFTQLLVREVAYGSLPKRLRAAWHEALADWFRSGGAAPDIVGTHLAEAYRCLRDLGGAASRRQALAGRAVDRLHEAGAAALARGECSWAVELLRRTAALQDELAAEGSPVADAPQIRVRLAEALITVGDRAAARELLEPAAAGEPDPRVRAHARLHLAQLDAGSKPRELPRTAAEVLAVFTAAGDLLGITRARLCLAQVSQRDGRYAESARSFEKALALGRRAGVELEQATALGGLATALWLGPAPVLQAVEECRRLLPAHDAGRRTVRAAVGCPLAVLHAMRRDFDAARALLAEAEQIVTELGVIAPMAAIHTFAGLVESLAGRTAQAEDRLRQAGELSWLAGDADTWTMAGTWTADLWLQGGRADDAEAWTERTPPGDASGVSPVTRSGFMALRARLLSARGRPEDAEQAAREALHLASRTDSLSCLATAHLAGAGAALAAGRREEALTRAADAERAYRDKGDQVGAGWVRRFREEAEAS